MYKGHEERMQHFSRKPPEGMDHLEPLEDEDGSKL